MEIFAKSLRMMICINLFNISIFVSFFQCFCWIYSLVGVVMEMMVCILYIVSIERHEFKFPIVCSFIILLSCFFPFFLSFYEKTVEMVVMKSIVQNKNAKKMISNAVTAHVLQTNGNAMGIRTVLILQMNL